MEYFEGPTKEELSKIYGEFGATDESLKSDVNTLMEWMDKTPHLPAVKDEEWLRHFLLCCKNSIERAKQRLDNYYTARTTSPEIFSGRPEMLPLARNIAQVIAYTPLPKLTSEGHRIIISRIYSDLNNPITTEALVKLTQMVYDLIIKTDFATEYIMIFDLENVTMSLVAAAFPAMKKLVTQLTKITPFRVKKLYVLNLSSVVEPLVNFAISLLSKKLADRTVVWKKKSVDLVEVFPPEILPPVYGGTERSMEELRDDFVEYFYEYGEWTLKDASLQADLSKKPNENGSLAHLGDYGIEGTFRKINLD